MSVALTTISTALCPGVTVSPSVRSVSATHVDFTPVKVIFGPPAKVTAVTGVRAVIIEYMRLLSAP